MVLAENGYDLTLSGRNEERLAVATKRASVHGGTVRSVAADLGDDQAVKNLVAGHLKQFGRIDALVNAAGVGDLPAATKDLPTERIDNELRINLRSVIVLVRECLPSLIAAGRDHGKAIVVSVSSEAADGGLENFSPYAASKAGLRAFMQSLQAEVRLDGVQATTLTPGFTATNLAAWCEKAGIDLRDLIQPEDLGAALRFLLQTTSSCIVSNIDFAPTTFPVIEQKVREWERSTGLRP
jgi:NAD(P)-dependent dehydrogenase (short-subunit alcohol dehydrogenase family)